MSLFQAAVAIPDENDTMLIHSGTQGVDFIQGAVCQALGKPFNKIQAGLLSQFVPHTFFRLCFLKK